MVLVRRHGLFVGVQAGRDETDGHNNMTTYINGTAGYTHFKKVNYTAIPNCNR